MRTKGRQFLNVITENKGTKVIYKPKCRGKKRTLDEIGNATADKIAKKARISGQPVKIHYQQMECKYFLKHRNVIVTDDYRHYLIEVFRKELIRKWKTGEVSKKK